MQLSRPVAEAGSNDMDMDVDDEQEIDPIQALPLKLDSLKRQVRRHIPLLKILRKPLAVVIEKQPSLPQRQKGMQRQRIERMSWQYWYDPCDLIRTILNATKLRDRMYFGMAQYVDEPTELWHSRAWGSSIRTTSGDVCYTRTGSLIIPGDLVRIRASSPYRIGRVTFVGRDCRSNSATNGEVVVTVQAVAEHPRNESILHNFDLPLDDNHELYLLEDVLLEQTPDTIDRQLAIYLDREYGDNEDEQEVVYPDDRFYIRRVLNIQSSSVRPLRQLHQTRAELEVAHFGRDNMDLFATNEHISMPYMLFIDDFGVHRNMYRALKAFYLIPACLSYEERRKLANVFTLTLGPHGANINDVVEAFSKPIQNLDRGMELEINGDMEKVCAFSITFLGDMPQQADNGGFMRHNARRGCRTCFCLKEERSDLKYDVVRNGRYHWETMQQREYARDLDSTKDRNDFVKDFGVRIEVPAVVKLAPALDIIQSRAYDAPHSEWRGLGRILQSFLMTSILSKRGVTAYMKAFQTFRFPPGWSRIQSPAFYIWSWSLSEAGKATLLTPLILRSQATVGWFRLAFLQAARNSMTLQSSPLREIIKAFGSIARANTLVGSQRYTEPDFLHQYVIEGRQAYQRLISYAIVTPAEGFGGEANINEDDHAEEREDDDIEALGDILSDAAISSPDSDEAIVPPLIKKGKQKGKRKGRKPQDTKYQKLLSLPNVHAGLHLAENAREYATVMNSNVLAGELKHK